MLSLARIEPGETVLEIGAGVGTLTVALARAGGRVTAVEVDGRFIPVLQAVCAPYPNVRIVHCDAMTLPPEMLQEAPEKVVANLPYAIASPLLINLLEAGLGRRFVVMVQREVAGRIVASPGSKSYGLLSVAVQARSAAAIAARVPRSAFFPPPEVDSAIVQIDVRAESAAPRPMMPLLMEVARAAFGQRRKMLRSALQSIRGRPMPAAAVEDLCRAAGVDPRRRGESLSLSEFSLLARALAAGTPGDRE